MKIFGYTLIRNERLEILESDAQRFRDLYHYHHWFSGWPNVHDLLSRFVHGKVWSGSVWGIREDFAKTMNTDRWGKPLEESK